MGFLRELTEPWALLLAASSAGAAWAVQLPWPAVLGVGLAVLAARAGLATWQHRGRDTAGEAVPRVADRSVEGRWLRRAEAAADRFATIGGSLPAGPLADSVGAMAPAVRETLDTLRTLASRATRASEAAAHIDEAALASERSRLESARQHGPADVRDHLDRSLAAVEEQQAVHGRLRQAHAALIAQLESGTLGLEGLVARAVELTATVGPGLPAAATVGVDELTDRLEGIRRGVVETDQATRDALGHGGAS